MKALASWRSERWWRHLAEEASTQQPYFSARVGCEGRAQIGWRLASRHRGATVECAW